MPVLEFKSHAPVAIHPHRPATSLKSYWHLSRSLATQTGMTNDWLKAQGLVSIRALWMQAQGYA